MKARKLVSALLVLSLFNSCATARGRFFFGAAGGAAIGGGTAALLSPNKESIGLNALVFGLVGALAGGLASAFLIKDPKPEPSPDNSLKGRELGIQDSNTKLFSISPTQKLPEFLKERLQPVIVEEAVEPDTVSDDGTLHEPHRIYRIQRQAELLSKPAQIQTQPEGK